MAVKWPNSFRSSSAARFGSASARFVVSPGSPVRSYRSRPLFSRVKISFQPSGAMTERLNVYSL
jgi:hypothetical protein